MLYFCYHYSAHLSISITTQKFAYALWPVQALPITPPTPPLPNTLSSDRHHLPPEHATTHALIPSRTIM